MSTDTAPDVDLADAIAELRDQVQLLWHSIDEDPNAVDFGQRINPLSFRIDPITWVAC